MQEFFSSTEDLREFRRKLERSGFTQIDGGPLFVDYEVGDIDITVQKSGRKGVSHEYEILLETHGEIENLPRDHPLFRFFRSLKQPCAHGSFGDNKPRYGIQWYLEKGQEKITIGYNVTEIDGKPGINLVSNITEGDPSFCHYSQIFNAFSGLCSQVWKDRHIQSGKLEITLDK